jgi:hypothetical protein
MKRVPALWWRWHRSQVFAKVGASTVALLFGVAIFGALGEAAPGAAAAPASGQTSGSQIPARTASFHIDPPRLAALRATLRNETTDAHMRRAEVSTSVLSGRAASGPLNLANFVTIDPNGNATVHSGAVSLVFGGIHSWQFLTVGFGLAFSDGARTLVPGQYDTSIDAQVFLSNDSSCGGQAGESGDGGFEIDQADYDTSGGLTAAALQFDFVCADGTEILGTIAYQMENTTPSQGYYLYDQFGDVTGFGNDSYLAYLNGAQYYDLNAPIVDMVPTPDGDGYWMVGSDGGVFASGDAGFFGSTGSLHLNAPVVGMAATPDGNGYWFVAADGGIFAYGDARFYGSTGAQHLNKPIVGMAATPGGKGYWLVASDGGIFAYGDAQFYGSTGGIHLNKAVVGMTPTSDGGGYWFVASDGGIFAYGDARFYGSTGSIHLNEPVVGMASTYDGGGYWLVASDGGLFNYGDAPFEGSLGGTGVTNVVGFSHGATQSLG